MIWITLETPIELPIANFKSSAILVIEVPFEDSKLKSFRFRELVIRARIGTTTTNILGDLFAGIFTLFVILISNL